MREVNLCNGGKALVDDEDYPLVSQYEWYQFHGYASNCTDGKKRDNDSRRVTVFMHRLILGLNRGEGTDHRNGNGLDNRKENLRVATHSQNGGNQQPRRGASSRYKGVSWSKKRSQWYAHITCKGQTFFLGAFSDERRAARAYDKAAGEKFKEFARTNAAHFPELERD